MGKLYAVGDIHGCYHALKKLLGKISPNRSTDRVIFLGDYVNRGKNSRRVIDTLIEFKSTHPRTVFLKGNHEAMLVDYLNNSHIPLFLQAGGIETLESYGVSPPDVERARRAIPESHKQFLLDLLPYWEEQNYLFVHAGFEKGRHPSRQSHAWLYWADREKFIQQSFPKDHKKIIFGHFANDAPIVLEDKIGIDSGAVYGGVLTCLILPDMTFTTSREVNATH